MDCSLPGSSVHGIFQARVLEWIAISFSKGESESLSVVSDSLQPHGLYSPWNSPGQNTGVGSLSLLRGSSQPRDWTQVSHIAGTFFTSWATREDHLLCKSYINREQWLIIRASLVTLMVKHMTAMQETQVWCLGQEDPLEKGMATHPSILVHSCHGQRSLVGYSLWGRLQRIGHDWMTKHTRTHDW